MNTGEMDLNVLLREMNPQLNHGEYVFCTFKDFFIPQGLVPLSTFRELEGLSAVVERDQADGYGLPYHFVCAWITLKIHSALEAVGLTAAVSAALEKAGISCNIIAAYYHDHLFVPYDEREKALTVLNTLTKHAAKSEIDHDQS